MNELVKRLASDKTLTKEEFIHLLDHLDQQTMEDIRKKSREITDSIYGRNIYIRGLIEISNYCVQNCYYCGIRRDNRNVTRYRLDKKSIMECCKRGYELGFRTFVMQGGEDPYYNDERMVSIISSIKKDYPDCAITLSLGVRSRESYERLRNAGADRYLLRHETSRESHFAKLHPTEQSFEDRKIALYHLKELGFTVGSGIMVGSPYQETEYIAEDLHFLQGLQPHMIGIGPFLPQKDTVFGHMPKGGYDRTLALLGILRMMFPKALIPSTTALGTIRSEGRLAGIEYGANVVMPNLSPLDHREDYALYDNKIATGDEAAESVESLRRSLEKIGYKIEIGRGDPRGVDNV